MKKILLSFICFVPLFVQAQTTEYENRKPSEEKMKILRNIFDMKMYHDPVIVKNALRMMRENSGFSQDLNYNVLFSDKDAAVLKAQVFDKKMENLNDAEWEAWEKQVDENPFETFMAFIENYRIPKMTQDQMDAINSVDKKAISDFLIMSTEAGPDVGATTVPAVYNN